MNQSPPPGFYPDPDGTQRWWDGAQWTAQTQQSQQGWQPGAPTPQPGRSKASWIIGGLVVLVLLIGGGIVAAVLAGGDSDGEDGTAEAVPADTVQAYFDALAEDDCEGMVEQVTERAANEPSMNCDTYDRDSMVGVDASNEIFATEDESDEATVTSREKFEHQEGTYEADCVYELVKQDGEWLIDDADCDRIND